jgi:hypothetical protein
LLPCIKHQISWENIDSHSYVSGKRSSGHRLHAGFHQVDHLGSVFSGSVRKLTFEWSRSIYWHMDASKGSYERNPTQSVAAMRTVYDSQACNDLFEH